MVEVQHSIVTNGVGPVFAGMAMQARTAYIASVHFETLTKQIGMVNYIIPAPEKGKVSVLEVSDTMVLIRQTLDPMEEPFPAPAPVGVEVLVKSLLKEWTEGFIGQAGTTRPGVMQIASSIPTQEEYDKLMSWEHTHCQAWVKEADFFEFSKQGRAGKMHTDAAIWLGLHLAGNHRKWLHGQKQDDFKIGAASGKQIPMKALVDDGVNLITFYKEMGIDPLTYNDTFAASFMANQADPSIITNGQTVIPIDPSLDNELDNIEFEPVTTNKKK